MNAHYSIRLTETLARVILGCVWVQRIADLQACSASVISGTRYPHKPGITSSETYYFQRTDWQFWLEKVGQLSSPQNDIGVVWQWWHCMIYVFFCRFDELVHLKGPYTYVYSAKYDLNILKKNILFLILFLCVCYMFHRDYVTNWVKHHCQVN